MTCVAPVDFPSVASEPWLADGEVLLHIGVPKTGTSAIQASLAAARPTLLSQGVTYPGQGASQYGAALSVIGRNRGWKKRRREKPDRWDRLAQRVGKVDGKVVVSGEVLCEADDATIARIVDDVGGSERVRVVVTLRPLEQLLPSSWQQYVKGGLSKPYDIWLDEMMKGPGRSETTPSFWIRNDHGRLTQRWAEAVGPERVAVVVADSQRPRMLFDVFETIIGLHPRTLTPAPDRRVNRSLSAGEAEIIRRLNELVGRTIDYDVYNVLIRNGAVERLVEGRRAGTHEAMLGVPPAVTARARQFGAETVTTIRRSGVTVFGDVDGLVPHTTPVDVDVTAPTDAPIDATMLVMDGLLRAAEAAIRGPHTATTTRHDDAP